VNCENGYKVSMLSSAPFSIRIAKTTFLSL